MTHEEKLELEEQIEVYGKAIDQWENTDLLFVHEEVRMLRHRVMYIHARLESSLVLLIGQYTFEPMPAEVPLDIRQWMMRRFHKIGGAMEFAPKVKLALELGVIDGQMHSMLFDVNNLRVAFSHPLAHETKIKSFLEPENHKKALKTLIDAFEKMNSFFRR